MRHHDVLEGSLGLLGGLGQDHTLASCEAISLDDDTVVDGVEVLASGLVVGEVLVASGGDVVALHEVLGKGLAALELGSGGARTEDLDARSMLLKVVGDTSDEGCLRARDEKVQRVVFGILDQSSEVVLGDAGAVDTLGHAARTEDG